MQNKKGHEYKTSIMSSAASASNSAIGSIQWPTKDDLPPLKHRRPSPFLSLFRPAKVHPFNSAESSVVASKLSVASKQPPPSLCAAFLTRIFCSWCILAQTGVEFNFEIKICLKAVSLLSESQRDIIANDSVYNNRFNYAVRFLIFHFNLHAT